MGTLNQWLQLIIVATMEMSTTFAIFCLLFGSIHAQEHVVRGGKIDLTK